MAHTHPSSGYNAVSIPTYNTSPSHTTRGYGGSPFHPKGQWCIPILVGSFLHGYGIPTAHIDTTVPPPPLISHNRNRSWHTSEVRTNAEPGPGRTSPPRRTNYERHEIPRDVSYHSNIHSETSGSRYTGVLLYCVCYVWFLCHSSFIWEWNIQIQRFSKFLQLPVATASIVWANERAEFKSFCNLIGWHGSGSCNRMLQELGKTL